MSQALSWSHLLDTSEVSSPHKSIGSPSRSTTSSIGYRRRHGLRSRSASPSRPLRDRTPPHSPRRDVHQVDGKPLNPAAEAYMRRSKQQGMEPALEFIVALTDHATTCSLASRRHPLGDADMVAIGETLRTDGTIEEIDLEANWLTKKGAADLAVALQENSTLKVIKLGENQLSDDGAMVLCSVLQKNTSVSLLDMKDNAIGVSGGKAVADLLQVNNALTELNLQKNSLADEACLAVARALRTNPTLVNLNLRFNDIGDVGGAACGDLLRVNSVLRVLDLGGNRIQDGATAIFDALCTNRYLHKLNLRSNAIPTTSCRALATALLTNNTLTELYLGYNAIDEDGVIQVTEALKTNTGLQRLDMQGIKLGPRGIQGVADALRSNATLIQLLVEAAVPTRDAGLCIASSLQCNTTLQDLVLGDVTFDDDIHKAIGTSLAANKLAARLKDPRFAERMTVHDGFGPHELPLVVRSVRERPDATTERKVADHITTLSTTLQRIESGNSHYMRQTDLVRHRVDMLEQGLQETTANNASLRTLQELAEQEKLHRTAFADDMADVKASCRHLVERVQQQEDRMRGMQTVLNDKPPHTRSDLHEVEQQFQGRVDLLRKDLESAVKRMGDEMMALQRSMREEIEDTRQNVHQAQCDTLQFKTQLQKTFTEKIESLAVPVLDESTRNDIKEDIAVSVRKAKQDLEERIQHSTDATNRQMSLLQTGVDWQLKELMNTTATQSAQMEHQFADIKDQLKTGTVQVKALERQVREKAETHERGMEHIMSRVDALQEKLDTQRRNTEATIAKWRPGAQDNSGVEVLIASTSARTDVLEQRVVAVDEHFKDRMSNIEERMGNREDQLNRELDEQIARIEERIASVNIQPSEEDIQHITESVVDRVRGLNLLAVEEAPQHDIRYNLDQLQNEIGILRETHEAALHRATTDMSDEIHHLRSAVQGASAVAAQVREIREELHTTTTHLHSLDRTVADQSKLDWHRPDTPAVSPSKPSVLDDVMALRHSVDDIQAQLKQQLPDKTAGTTLRAATPMSDGSVQSTVDPKLENHVGYLAHRITALEEVVKQDQRASLIALEALLKDRANSSLPSSVSSSRHQSRSPPRAARAATPHNAGSQQYRITTRLSVTPDGRVSPSPSPGHHHHHHAPSSDTNGTNGSTYRLHPPSQASPTPPPHTSLLGTGGDLHQTSRQSVSWDSSLEEIPGRGTPSIPRDSHPVFPRGSRARQPHSPHTIPSHLPVPQHHQPRQRMR